MIELSSPATIPSEPIRSDDEREVVVAVHQVGKMYRIYARPIDRLKQMLLWRFGRSYGREFWALRDVSFTIRRGDTVGIIGRNGSGKSTLLQLIAGTLAPTEGTVQVHGRIAALLELGSGFNPEFTGRENVFLNGSILGISRSEMEERFDRIAAFADIGDFIDQPVKTYSSGMTLRLAFAVGVHVEPDLLIVDEALSVGDIRFQKKCIQKMEELRDNGTTILFVSHDAHLIERFCTTAIVMDHGNVVASGNTTAAMAFYQNLMLERSPVEVTDGVAPVETTYATGDVELIDVTLLDAQEQAKRIFQTHEAMTIRMRYRVVNAVPNAFVGISFWTEKDTRVGQAHSVFESPVPINLDGATEFFIDCVIAPLSLLPGTYYIRGGVYDKNIHFAYCLWGWTDRTIGLFSVDSSVVNGFVLKPSLGYVQFPSEWRTSLTDEQTL